MKKLILFGTGHDGEEALVFFGSEYIYCYTDNDTAKIGTQMHRKEVIDPNQLKEYNDAYDIVVAISKSRWMMFSVACQLRRMGIEEFSVYADIRKHFKSGLEFIQRDRERYPYEQESVSEIYKLQLDYIVRHTDRIRTDYYRNQLDSLTQNMDSSVLKPATGELRRRQLWIVALLNEFLMRLKQETGIVPALADGTLLGAVRHGGFIPWDDDIDISVLHEDFLRLVAYFEEADDMDVFYLSMKNGEESWRNSEGIDYRDSTKRYLVAYSFGYLSIFLNMKSPYMRQNVSVCDIFPLRYMSNAMSVEGYKNEIDRRLALLKKNVDDMDSTLRSMAENSDLYCLKSNRIGYGFDFLVYISYWSEIQGRGASKRKIWDITDYLPLQELSFEGYLFGVPRNYQKWLADEYGEDYKKLSQRVGIYVHDKERIFKEYY